MSEKEIIEKLILKAQEMRNAQAQYFLTRDPFRLKDSKGKETAFDEFVQHLRRLGYSPENAKSAEPIQKNLF